MESESSFPMWMPIIILLLIAVVGFFFFFFMKQRQNKKIVEGKLLCEFTTEAGACYTALLDYKDKLVKKPSIPVNCTDPMDVFPNFSWLHSSSIPSFQTDLWIRRRLGKSSHLVAPQKQFLRVFQSPDHQPLDRIHIHKRCIYMCCAFCASVFSHLLHREAAYSPNHLREWSLKTKQ